MTRNDAAAARRFTSTLLRVGYLVGVVLFAFVGAYGFRPLTDFENLPFAIGFVLLIPVVVSFEFIRGRHRAPQDMPPFLFGMPGIMILSVAGAILLFATILLWPSALPAFIVTLALVLAWIGAALLAISNLLLLFALISSQLARFRPSA